MIILVKIIKSPNSILSASQNDTNLTDPTITRRFFLSFFFKLIRYYSGNCKVVFFSFLFLRRSLIRFDICCESTRVLCVRCTVFRTKLLPAAGSNQNKHVEERPKRVVAANLNRLRRGTRTHAHRELSRSGAHVSNGVRIRFCGREMKCLVQLTVRVQCRRRQRHCLCHAFCLHLLRLICFVVRDYTRFRFSFSVVLIQSRMCLPPNAIETMTTWTENVRVVERRDKWKIKRIQSIDYIRLLLLLFGHGCCSEALHAVATTTRYTHSALFENCYSGISLIPTIMRVLSNPIKIS